jgi:hypothetical protein
MVLLFDMFLSLLVTSDGVSFKTMRIRFYSRIGPKRLKFSDSLWLE